MKYSILTLDILSVTNVMEWNVTDLETRQHFTTATSIEITFGTTPLHSTTADIPCFYPIRSNCFDVIFNVFLNINVDG